MLVLWNCTADTTKVSVFCDKRISLLVQTSISSLQCFNLRAQYTMLCFTMMGQTECLSQNVCHFVPRGKMLRCEMIPGRVKNKNNTKRTGFTEARSSSLMWVYYVCVHGCMCVCVISVFLLKLSFRKAPSPWLVCTDVSRLFATLILSKYHTSESCLSFKKKKRQALQCKMQKQKMFSPVQNSPGSADWEVWQNISGHAAKFISISSSQSCIFTSVFKVSVVVRGQLGQKCTNPVKWKLQCPL